MNTHEQHVINIHEQHIINIHEIKILATLKATGIEEN